MADSNVIEFTGRSGQNPTSPLVQEMEENQRAGFFFTSYERTRKLEWKINLLKGSQHGTLIRCIFRDTHSAKVRFWRGGLRRLARAHCVLRDTLSPQRHQNRDPQGLAHDHVVEICVVARTPQHHTCFTESPVRWTFWMIPLSFISFLKMCYLIFKCSPILHRHHL